MAQAGYAVTLIAPHDRDETLDGIAVRAVPVAAGRRERMLRTARQVYRRAREVDADIYHFHDPELILTGVLLKLHGKRVVYDVHEDLPRQILSKWWIAPSVRTATSLAAEGIEWVGARIFDRIVCVTSTIARRFPARKTRLVQNFPVREEFAPVDAPAYQERPAEIIYIGAISRERGIGEMIEAFALLREAVPATFTVAGIFQPSSLQAEVAQLPAWGPVRYFAQQPREQVVQLLAHARAGLVIFYPEPNHIDAQPNKLFEYMAAGIPVVASDFPLWREIIAGTQCGLLVDPLQPRQIADALRWLLEHPAEAEAMGKRGQDAARTRFTWSSEECALLEMYRELSE